MILLEVIDRSRVSTLVLRALRKYSSNANTVNGRRKMQTNTAGIIVIGDEVLKGQVHDVNSHFLSKGLYEVGIKLLKVSVISDSVELISKEVAEFSKKYDYVLTTGGIGPTHDDVTYEAVAHAFGEEVHYHPDIVKMCFEFFKTSSMNHPSLKLARIPKSARLTYGYDKKSGQKSLYPNVAVQNVFIFPGVPHLCQRMFSFTVDKIVERKSKFYMKELYFKVGENEIVEQLNAVVKLFPEVNFGSYPEFFHSYYSVRITIESTDEHQAEEAISALKTRVPAAHQVQFDNSPYSDKKEKLAKVQSEMVREVMGELAVALKTHGLGLYLYFDGGKNSTLLLHLLSVLFQDAFPKKQMSVICVINNPKVGKFAADAGKAYGVKLLRMDESDLRRFLRANQEVVVVKGTRGSDPQYKAVVAWLDTVAAGRVANPLLRWHYGHVWAAIRALCLPYCPLYDQGYTSVGSPDSRPNPKLLTDGPRKDLRYYRKAHRLQDPAWENWTGQETKQ